LVLKGLKVFLEFQDKEALLELLAHKALQGYKVQRGLTVLMGPTELQALKEL
jgi:hypothetical protein